MSKGYKKHGLYILLHAVSIATLSSSLALLLFATWNCGNSSTTSPGSSAGTPKATYDLLPSGENARNEDEISIADLPLEARQTIQLIKKGGPFPYSKDGAVFGNREGLLIGRPHGYYREYTVSTPGARDRGARRIIAGKNEEYYYTDDHYRSFKRIRE